MKAGTVFRWTTAFFGSLLYHVELDRAAFARMRELTGGLRMVPVLVEDGKVIESGWQGRGCVVGEK